ncbi:MAG TPA: GTP 3',8-cyclase MoaA [Burkholderiaceae bacterium]|nr:GTP 3',8-cyclase MoaA [Burkholderiaceae bacterium]
MTDRVIPIAEARYQPLPLPKPRPLDTESQPIDLRGRPMHDLRISVTDRCNFRCTYCMPKEVFGRDYPFLPQSSLLSFEEITRLAQAFVHLGVRKLRLTGGEPLLRKQLDRLVSQLAQLRTPQGEPLDLTLTTNGSLLERHARALRDAGLGRVTVSLDALDDAIFKRMNDADYPVADVLRGIDAALTAGFTALKVNMVVQRGVNDAQIIPMARHFRGTGVTLRFIEYMDVGSTNGWRMNEVLPSRDLIERLSTVWPLEPVDRDYRGEVAERWRYVDGAGEIGVISSVTHAFCGDCTRARLSTEGRLYLCLFAQQGYDLRGLVRDGNATPEALAGTIAAIWSTRRDNYSELRSANTAPAQKIEMSYIGG